ncbi:unnamed protein product [Coffea canephora]|uniref:Uncharacterized protein n=1 Tax=Coffea canephora TaxID=49390 RepID=A0A068UDJ0_COFCA|nr:unnamed protein product [Coffea canephora]
MLSAIFAVNYKGQAQCKAISELNASDSSIQLPSFMNHMKEINDKGSSPAQEFDASRTPLNPNPIAGCAALASLMSKCSQDGKTATLVPKYENIVKTLFPSKEATREPKIVDASTEEMKQESKNEECRPQTVDSVANVSTKKNLDVAAGSTLSCSAKQRSSEVSCKNVDMAFIAGQKPMPSMNTRRFTRSAVRKAEEKVVAEANNVIKENPSLVRGSALAQDQKTVVSPIDDETASTITHKFTDPEANTGIYKINHFVKKSCAAGMLTLNNSRRLTRSAVRGKTENNNVESHKTFEESRLSDYVKIDSHNGDNVSESNASEAQKMQSLQPFKMGFLLLMTGKDVGNCKSHLLLGPYKTSKVMSPAMIDAVTVSRESQLLRRSKSYVFPHASDIFLELVPRTKS